MFQIFKRWPCLSYKKQIIKKFPLRNYFNYHDKMTQIYVKISKTVKFCANNNSNSVLFKTTTKYVQWYYDGLVPWVNYIPVRPDMSDV